MDDMRQTFPTRPSQLGDAHVRQSSATTLSVKRPSNHIVDRLTRSVYCRIASTLIALGVAGGALANPPVTDEIAAIVSAKATDRGDSTVQPEHRPWLARIYASGDRGAVWFTATGARPAVAVALAQIRHAASRGLSVADYDIERLERDVEGASRADPPARTIAHADVAMTAAMLAFLSDLRYGRVRPQDVEPHYRVAAKEALFVATLREAVTFDRLAETIDRAEPSFPQYARLKQLLARYQDLAAQPPLLLPPFPQRRTKLMPGDRYTGVRTLYAQLIRSGDLPAGAAEPVGDIYSDALAAAVTRFQERHGLHPDGVIGEQTLAELNVPPEMRMQQITLSLERLRWLPDLPAGPLIAINIPSFRLWAVANAQLAGGAALSMPVIVGKAMRGETPVFIGEMRYVEFSPYWNVPPSILRNELLPQLARDPTLLQREDMEIVSTRGVGPARVAVDDLALAGLRSGELRLRQRPGPKNALGGVKFVLPNTMNIYLHSTPARALFERTRRDFSHGCIRVREPAALAQFVLSDQPEWTPAQIDAAMTSGTNRMVKLAAPIPVVVFYTTAIVEADGRPMFLPDIYGHDRKLASALRAARHGAP